MEPRKTEYPMHLKPQIHAHLYLNVNVGDMVIFSPYFLIVSINSVYIVVVSMPEIKHTVLNGPQLILKE